MPRKVIHYSPSFAFVRSEWTIPIDAPRELIPVLCEHLESIISERQGASFYYPDIASETTTCRFEWPRKWQNWKYGIHLGLLFRVSDENLTEITAYATTDKCIEDRSSPLPQFSKVFLERIQQEIIQVLQQAANQLAAATHQDRIVIFYLELHPSAAFATDSETEDKRIKILPSTSIDGKVISPIGVLINAPSNQHARPKALYDAMLFGALYTLACGSLCQTTSPEWGKNQSHLEFLQTWEGFDIESLYPSRNALPLLPDESAHEKSQAIWRLFQGLPEARQEEFLTALFSYYSGQNINYKQSTLAIVAYVAALSSLAKKRKKKCTGELVCSKCGPLTMKHDSVGDKAAIVLLVIHYRTILSDG